MRWAWAVACPCARLCFAMTTRDTTRDRGITVYDEGGEDFYPEGTDGRIGFSNWKVLEGKNYGKYKGRGKGFNKDVEPDEEMLQ